MFIKTDLDQLTSCLSMDLSTASTSKTQLCVEQEVGAGCQRGHRESNKMKYFII